MMMILLKGTRFPYTPTSISFTKQRGSYVYFVHFFVSCFHSKTNCQLQYYSTSKETCFFLLLLYDETIAQRLITISSWLVRIRNLIFIIDHDSLLIESQIFRG